MKNCLHFPPAAEDGSSLAGKQDTSAFIQVMGVDGADTNKYII
jgi:hypothetical protein